MIIELLQRSCYWSVGAGKGHDSRKIKLSIYFYWPWPVHKGPINIPTIEFGLIIINHNQIKFVFYLFENYLG